MSLGPIVKSFMGVVLAGLTLSGAAESQTGPSSASPVPLSLTYADLADLAVSAPVAAHVRLRRAVPLKPAEAVNVRPGFTRFYVQADVVSLVRAPAGLPAQVSYLADLPSRADGKPPKLAKKTEYLVLGSAVPGRPGELRLIAPDAQIQFTPQRAETVRSILREATGASPAPAITGIGRAFHSPGSLPGESETQIFLRTAEDRPVSLSILRRPGEVPRWALALAEVVDDAAEAPRPNTLLWYRLACGLPRSLPPQSLAEAEAQYHGAIQADYRLVLSQLGSCVRTRR
jgi:hypothetical protein